MLTGRHLVSTVLAMMIIASTATAQDFGSDGREGSVIGLFAGHGWNTYTYDSGSQQYESDAISTMSGALHVGWAQSHRLILGLGIYVTQRDFNEGLVPIRATTLGILGEAKYFPRGEGFWLKAGAGTGSLDFYAPLVDPSLRADFQESGFTYCLGTGYEVLMNESMAIGLALDYVVVDVGEYLELTNVKATSMSLGLSLHYYP